MARKTQADDTFEPTLFLVGFVGTKEAGQYQCAVVARTAIDAIDQAEDLITLQFKEHYAIMSVEPMVKMGVSPADG